MGIFSSSYVTSVNTSVSRAVEDKQLPQTVKGATIEAIFKDGNIPNYIVMSFLEGIAIKTERMYAYAKTDYPTGLPSKSVIYAAASEEKLLSVLSSILGNISVDYTNLGAMNLLHTAWIAVTNTHGHNSTTNELTALTAVKGFKVYLKDLVPIVKDSTVAELNNGSLDSWGANAKSGTTPERIGVSENLRGFTPLLVDPSATEDYVKMVYVWEKVTSTTFNGVTTETKEIKEESLNIVVQVPLTPADHLQVRYLKDGTYNYYTYVIGSGTPTLDAIYSPTPYNGEGSYFPNIYFRRGGASMSKQEGSADYKASVRMGKLLGMDYEAILKGVDENPDASKVEQAFLTMATPAISTKSVQAAYLFDFFNDAYIKAGGRNLSRAAAYAKTSPISIVIQDKYFKCALGFGGIYRETRGGVLGKIGTCKSELGNLKTSVDITRQQGNYLDGATVTETIFVDTPVHYYRKQITESHYQEVQVIDLSMSYDIKNGYATVGTKDDPILLVPIDYAIARKYSLSDRENLYASSLHFVFNAYQEQEVQWYQQGWFSNLLIIIAIVYTVITFDANGGFELIALALAGSEMAVQYLVMMAIEAILYSQVVSAIASAILSVVGVELAFFIAIAAVIYSGYEVYSNGGIKGAPFAEKLLFVSNTLTTGISKKIQLAYNDLRSEYANFEAYAKEKTEELEKLTSLLDQSTLLSPFIIFGEKPGDYFNRTIHTGNIGVMSVAAIGSYVDAALTLPSFADSTEQFLQG